VTHACVRLPRLAETLPRQQSNRYEHLLTWNFWHTTKTESAGSGALAGIDG
jgi:hypothetical protein